MSHENQLLFGALRSKDEFSCHETGIQRENLYLNEALNAQR
jgi:hypothetical protein